MRTLLVSHPVFERHAHPNWHPERPERLEAVIGGARDSGAEIVDVMAEEVEMDVLHRVHPPEYAAAIESFCRSGGGNLDADTYAGAASWEAAIRAAGAGPQAVRSLAAGECDVAFLAVRPPGHHALERQAMGFCLFNNVAVTARWLADQGERVAIIDWDVHHGNGTQDLFVADRRVLYVSTHEYPFYPGSGWIDEVGYGPGAGTIVNVPVPAQTGGDVYQVAYRDLVAPIVRQFDPTWVLVSAGYDAHSSDPLADLMLESCDYHALSREVAGLAPAGRTIFFLEGGYDLAAIRASVCATLDGAGGLPAPAGSSAMSPATSWRTLDQVAQAMRPFWEIGQVGR